MSADSLRHAWAGRFSASPAAALDAINRSIGFDRRLWREDIEGSRAHATMLHQVGLLSADDLAAILQGLQQVHGEFEAGTFVVESHDEDIHMAVERRLTELVGDPGRRLHTGRSRNDQVATDLRLWCRRACDDLRAALASLVSLLGARALDHAADPMPAYTHLQRGMPTTVGHHLLAWAESFLRDIDRFGDVRRRLNVSPLGSGACVGSRLPLDRHATAALLGFDGITANSLDAVSDRDFVAEFLFAASLAMTHLSRIGEEVVLWSSQEFAFVTLSDAVTTGSSMMPNKKNPDGAELLRGKSGRVLGRLVGWLTTLKGLPLAYNKDLQEDKEPVFDAFDTLMLALHMAVVLVEGMRFRTDRLAAACTQHVNATDFCELLVAEGVPLRTAHHQTGRLVAQAIARGVELQELPLAEVCAEAPAATADLLAALALPEMLAAKALPGGTAPMRVSEAARALESRLDALMNHGPGG
jgi:argininosuccinate lyase